MSKKQKETAEVVKADGFCFNGSFGPMVDQINQDMDGAEVGMFRMMRAGVGLLAIKGLVEHGSWETRMTELFPGRSGRTLQTYMQQARPFLANNNLTANQAWGEVAQIDPAQLCAGQFMGGGQPLQIGAGAAEKDGPAKRGRKASKEADPDEGSRTFSQMLLDFIQQRKRGKDRPAEPPKPLTKREKVDAAIAEAARVVNIAGDWVADGTWALLPGEELESAMAGLRAAADRIRDEFRSRK